MLTPATTHTARLRRAPKALTRDGCRGTCPRPHTEGGEQTEPGLAGLGEGSRLGAVGIFPDVCVQTGPWMQEGVRAV